MHNRIRLLTLATLAAVFSLSVATVSGKARPAALVLVTPSATAAPTMSASSAIDPSNFVSTIDNPYFSLKPGTTYIYEGKTEKGNEHVEVIVRSETKISMGVKCVVVEDTVTIDGKVEEGTLDWYAQDKQGNVWYFGEDTREYQDGKVVSTKGTWEAGVNGARPGYAMKAVSAIGDVYRQEYYRGEAEDMAAVINLSGTASVPAGTYTNVLVISEWNALVNPLVFEHKYYAKGVGLTLIKAINGGFELKLVEIRHQ